MNLKVVLPGIVVLPRQTIVVLEQVYSRGDGTHGALSVFDKTEHIRFEFQGQQPPEGTEEPSLSGKNYLVDYCQVNFEGDKTTTLIHAREIHVGAH
ncbi:hypothetical protein [Kyrpidia tusciae]|uniref:Uncharacterized protein n=1 Tax=Kyrpidia tusciae (strain DSM 2912 / NBRC 15312 / T2) TaxID=562970 RepID=D5WSZ7_KYRT2|nr:hypothetical protein [Kyrpidia tusciae]ADG05101.1 hypothetical protein Btus_0329 [Kyrpidia tusciae DSM 2912]MBE3553330.1 hypothetical protein [Kyrpidia tusciae]